MDVEALYTTVADYLDSMQREEAVELLDLAADGVIESRALMVGGCAAPTLDLPVCATGAHRMANVCAVLRSEELARAVNEVERAAKQDDVVAARSAWAAVEADVEALIEMIARLRTRYSTRGATAER